MLIAAVLLAACQESVAAQAERLAADPIANRAALIKLGPAAIRPLLELKKRELDGVLAELRIGSDDAIARDLRQLAPAGRTGGIAAGKLLAAYGFVDAGLPERVTAVPIDIGLEKGTRESHLQRLCVEAGLEYRALRGRIVISTAERLWAWPAPGRSDEKALRRAASDLASTALETREAATKVLLHAGEAALPFIDESVAEAAAVAEKIRLRAKPPFWIETLALERQDLDDAGRAVLKTIREGTAPIDFNGYEMADALHILFEKSDVKWNVGAGVKAPIPQGEVRTMSTLDAIWWLTIPWGYDAWIRDGKLVVDGK